MKRLLFLLIFFSSYICFSQEISSFSSDRPGQAFSSTIITSKVFQVQTGFDYYSSQDLFNINSYFRYGLVNNLELNVNVGYDTGITSNISSLELGSRIALTEKKRKIQSAIQVSANLPISQLNFNSKVLLILDGSFTDKLSWNTNFAVQFDDNFEATTNYVLNLGYTITNRFGVFLETFGSIDTNQDFTWDTGFYYTLSRKLQLDLFGGNNNGFFASVGFTFKSL